MSNSNKFYSSSIVSVWYDGRKFLIDLDNLLNMDRIMSFEIERSEYRNLRNWLDVDSILRLVHHPNQSFTLYGHLFKVIDDIEVSSAGLFLNAENITQNYYTARNYRWVSSSGFLDKELTAPRWEKAYVGSTTKLQTKTCKFCQEENPDTDFKYCIYCGEKRE